MAGVVVQDQVGPAAELPVVHHGPHAIGAVAEFIDREVP